MIGMKKKHQSAFTVLELLGVSAIIAILACLALPSLQQLQRQHEANHFAWQLKTPLQEARHTAMTFHWPVTVCGSSDAQHCDQHWHQGLLLFIDRNQNQVFDSADAKLSFYPQTFKYGTIELHAFGAHSSILVFSPEKGIPLASNASFYYCSQKPMLNRSLAISRMGHVRESTRNGLDGMHKTATGNPIMCSGLAND